MTWRWPRLWWRRRDELDAAARARAAAAARLGQARRDWPAVREVADEFGALIETAMRRGQP